MYFINNYLLPLLEPDDESDELEERLLPEDELEFEDPLELADGL
jgi:hypothetical protein